MPHPLPKAPKSKKQEAARLARERDRRRTAFDIVTGNTKRKKVRKVKHGR